MPQSSLELPPLSLYIHLPWCVRKCPYCDFNSHAIQNSIPEKRYIDALLADLNSDLFYRQNRPLTSIFFGGGTPSLFSPQSIHTILEQIKSNIMTNKNIEITLEANPGTIDENKFLGFRQAGVNRLSVGIQSFANYQLKQLGRIHSSTDALNAVEKAKKADFESINIDLMYGLPKQTIKTALNDLKMAISLQPNHISWYQLTIEPNTVFYNKPPTLPTQDSIWEIYQQGLKLLKNAGYQQYEISAYAKEGYQSQHNLNYWQFGDYIGIGAGAHSKLTNLANQKIIRIWKTRQPNDYMKQPYNFIAGKKLITPNELPLEFMMNALRLNSGVAYDLFPKRTGLSLDSIEKSIKTAREKQLLHDGKLQTTDKGQQFLNDLLLEFS